MKERILIRPNAYFDSVTLMSVSQKIQRLNGVEAAMVGMGTPLNMDVMQTLGFGEDVQATPNDLIIAVKGMNEKALEEAFAQVDKLLTKGSTGQDKALAPAKSLVQALERQKSNLALISVPGAYAAREARKALELGLHVMLFSDNVSLADEAALKKLAHEKGLLLMGPDCGTAIINGVPLAFANVVRRGAIGIVGASGTGVQEVCVQIDHLGLGVSQVIGTGGRDLKSEVGGVMMLDGIEALREDPQTEVIVVISKPASLEVTARVYNTLKECGKPAVLYVIGAKTELPTEGTVKVAGNLLETAQLAVRLAGGETESAKTDTAKTGVESLATELVKRLMPGQRYVRGLFSGGTLCDEAMETLAKSCGLIYSNTPLTQDGLLADPNGSRENTVLDLGDDQFTVGRPHPMIDLSLRISRMYEEARDQETAVILFDVVLGYGSHSDPQAELVPAVQKAQQIAREGGRDIIFAAYVCGTANDPQGYQSQVQALRDAEVEVFRSNVEAAEFVAAVLNAVDKGDGK